MAPHPPALPAPPRPPRRTVDRLPTTATPDDTHRHRSNPPQCRAPTQPLSLLTACATFSAIQSSVPPLRRSSSPAKTSICFDNAPPSSVLIATVRPPPVPSSSMRRLNLVR
ncbi:hypothetical protein U1Q18_014593 [Sarracenia purpurea var. burkii]